MGTRYGAVDCGSNSFRLLIVEVVANEIIELYRDLRMVQLGYNLEIAGGTIDSITAQRCLGALSCFKDIASHYQCDDLFCVGTSALRSAGNADIFCQQVYQQLGIVIDIIDGDTEAWYSFSGAVGSKELKSGVAVLDIGGGSTELAISTDQRLLSCSIPAGSVRMDNIYCNSGCITENQLARLDDYVKKLWDTHWNRETSRINRFIGVAGTITTLAAVKLRMKDYDPDKINGTELTYPEIKAMLDRLNSLSIEQKAKIPGVASLPRAKTMVAGLGILLATLEYWDQQSIEVRDSSLLQGLLFEKILAQKC